MSPGIIVTPCFNHKYCKNPKQIEDFAKDLRLTVYIKAQLYDSEEYDRNPVKDNIELYSIPIFKSFQTTNHGKIYITEETLENEDKLYSLGLFSDLHTFFTSSKDFKTTEFF